MRQIVINCYKYHGREDLLPAFIEDDDKNIPGTSENIVKTEKVKPRFSATGSIPHHTSINLTSLAAANNTNMATIPIQTATLAEANMATQGVNVCRVVVPLVGSRLLFQFVNAFMMFC